MKSKHLQSQKKCKCLIHDMRFVDAHCPYHGHNDNVTCSRCSFTPAKKEFRCWECKSPITLLQQRMGGFCKNCAPKFEPKDTGVGKEVNWEERFDELSEWETWRDNPPEKEDYQYDLGFLQAQIKIFIQSELQRQKKEILRGIKKWTKDRNVTKDKLRNYLNLELEEKEDGS